MSVIRSTSLAWVFLCGLSIGGAQAQSLPKIEEFYFDADSAAAALNAVPEQGDGAVDSLMKLRERGRKSVEATSQLARIAVAQGRVDLGHELHKDAMATTTLASTLGRSVRWNYAWDLFYLGDVAPAMVLWSEVQGATRGSPSWVPATYALALWTQGKQDEAVRWYAAAVRTEPQLWSDAGNLAGLLPHWREQDRAVLAQVQAAWSANPPGWP